MSDIGAPRHDPEPVADDVATPGLDILVKEAGHRRSAFNPYLPGY